MLTKAQRDLLKAAREYLCMLQEPPYGIHPLDGKSKVVTEIIADIENLLGY